MAFAAKEIVVFAAFAAFFYLMGRSDGRRHALYEASSMTMVRLAWWLDELARRRAAVESIADELANVELSQVLEDNVTTFLQASARAVRKRMEEIGRDWR